MEQMVNPMKVSTVTDNVHGTIKISNFEKMVMETPYFVRLHNIYQSSTVYLTYPCCRTHRCEHSIGTMYLVGEMFRNSICNASDKTVLDFITKTRELLMGPNVDVIIGNWRQDNSIFNDVFFNDFSPSCISNEDNLIILRIMYTTIRIVGLLHDVGHPPYSHVVEKAIKKFLIQVKWEHFMNQINSVKKQKPRLIENEVSEWIKKTLDEGVQPHEMMGTIIIKNLFSALTEETKECEDYSSIFGFIASTVCDIMTASDEATKAVDEMRKKETGTDRNGSLKQRREMFLYALKTLISSTIDADRLDCIVRDMQSAGTGDTFFPYKRVLNNMKMTLIDGIIHFSFSYKVIDLLDTVLNKRFYIYNYINFHHRSQKMATMLEDILLSLLMDRYHTFTDSEFETSLKGNYLPTTIDGFFIVLRSLFTHKKNKKTEKNLASLLLQWDDNWIMTMLRNYLFNPVLKVSVSKDSIAKIEELLAGRRRYKSVIKRETEVHDFSKKVFELLTPIIKQNSQYLQLNNMNQIFDSKGNPIICNTSAGKAENDEFIPDFYSLFSVIMEYDYGDPFDVDSFIMRFEDILNNGIETDGKNQKKSLYLFKVASISRTTGISGTVTLFDDNTTDVNHYFIYKQESAIDENLRRSIAKLPPFYIYCRKVDGGEVNPEQMPEIISFCAKAFVEEFDDFLQNCCILSGIA